MRYKPLLEISIVHPYYEDGRCPDLRVGPGALGEAILRRYRLALKRRAGGVLVIAPVDEAGAPFVPFAEDAALSLEVRAEGDDFHLITDSAALLSMDAPVYTNAAGQAPLPSGALALVDRGAGAPGAGGRPRRGALAGVEIAGLRALAPSDAPAAFSISFAPRSARWIYYVVTDVPAASGAIEIVDAAPAPADPVVFGPAGARDLVAAPDAGDAVAAALAARYPGLRRLRFASDAPVVSGARGRKHIELRVNGDRALEALPNPSIRWIARIAAAAAAPPEEARVCVVEHVTRGALASVG